MHPGDRDHAASLWRRAVANRDLYETEYRLRRADGEYRHVSVRGAPVLGPDGNVREWAGTCSDITEHKLAEDAILRLARDR